MTTNHKLRLHDINQSAFQDALGNPPELVNINGTVTFLFEPDDRFYDLAERYDNDEPIPVKKYVASLRKLRALMMTMKSDNERGNGHGRHSGRQAQKYPGRSSADSP